jgi:predicted RNA-binding Zn ribbon-like protein
MKMSDAIPQDFDYSAELEIGGHLALAFINTVSLQRGETIDLFQDDDEVRNWLRRVGLPTSRAKNLPSGALLSAARSLRELLRENIVRRKRGRTLNLAELNGFLTQACSHLEITRDEERGYRLRRVWFPDNPEQLLAPLADAGAQLLVEGDFSLVKRCESHECVFWFLDSTKAHKRRWCSMATCGNRAKVSKYRARQTSPSGSRSH